MEVSILIPNLQLSTVSILGIGIVPIPNDNKENSMESHAEVENSITTKERVEISSEEEQSSIIPENSSEEESIPGLH